MTTSSAELVEIMSPDGQRVLTVSPKAFLVVYQPEGFTLTGSTPAASQESTKGEENPR